MTELLYNKSKAVAALNKVEGFNPLELARRISNEGEAEQLYLDVKYRKLWFRLLNPTGKIISNIISLTENMAVVEARVYLDKCDQKEDCVGNSYAQRFRTADPKFGDKFLELAETAATGRALADAGYGVQFADVGEENDPLQVDAGIPVPPNLETPQPNGTMQMPVNSGQTPNNGSKCGTEYGNRTSRCLYGSSGSFSSTANTRINTDDGTVLSERSGEWKYYRWHEWYSNVTKPGIGS